MKPIKSICALAMVLALTACGGGGTSAGKQVGSAASPNARTLGMANPASRYCAEKGGRLEIRAEDAGQAGYCHLPDGTTLEEWELYRGKNAL